MVEGFGRDEAPSGRQSSMCLIAWRTAASAPWPLLLAANRDEFHDREALAVHRWPVWPTSFRLGRHRPGRRDGVSDLSGLSGLSGLRDPGSAGVAAAAATASRAFIFAGRDLVGGGTWLGLAVTDRGLRIAMLTNLRNGRAGPVAPDAPSRGLLVTDVLVADEPVDAAMARLGAHDDLPRMAGFNLVAIDLIAQGHSGTGHSVTGHSGAGHSGTAQAGREPGLIATPGFTIATSYLAHAGPGAASKVMPCQIDEGVHGLSNGELDAPWPKTRALMAAVARAGALRDAAEPDPAKRRDSPGPALAGDAGGRDAGRAGTGGAGGAAAAAAADADTLLLDCLADRRPAPAADLPDTGIDAARESWLSSPFIASEQYGTRCSTLIAVGADGRFEILERRYDREGNPVGDARESG